MLFALLRYDTECYCFMALYDTKRYNAGGIVIQNVFASCLYMILNVIASRHYMILYVTVLWRYDTEYGII